MTRSARGLAAASAGAPLTPWTFERRDLRPDDVAVEVTYCGVCHTDVHAWRGDPPYGNCFPLVPGHEFVGIVAEVGNSVTQFARGDYVAVGNIVDSCGVCARCVAGSEQYCHERPTLTYGGTDRRDGRPNYGAYSTEYVVTDRFAYHLPEGLDPAGAAPLMCAGVSVWEPLRRSEIGPGSRVGVVGLGGLGHLAVKFAVALGASVDVFTTSATKIGAAKLLGAGDVVVTSDLAQMAAARGRCDFVLDTVAVPHELSGYLGALRFGGTLCLVGALAPTAVNPVELVGRSLTVSGGCGRPETLAMLDFCGRHGIIADVEVLPASSVNVALARLENNDVHFRFSLNMADLDSRD